MAPSPPPWAHALTEAATPSEAGAQAYEDTLAQVRHMMAAHSAPQGGGAPWAEISGGCQVLLRQDKDLKVAAYLVLAHSHLEGAAACASGLTALAVMLREHWQAISPPVARERGRLAALSWLHEELGHVLGAQGDVAPPIKAALDEAAQGLDETLAAMCTLQPPAFIHVARAVAAAQPARAHAPPAAAPAPARQPAAHEPSPSASAPQGEPAPLPDADHLVDLGELLLRQADAHLAHAPLHVGALRLRRQGLWLHIEGPPPPVGDVTRVAPLPKELQHKLAALHEGQDWQQLWQTAEAAMPQHRLILSLQRLSAEAARHLAQGSQDGAASRAIGAETLNLVARVPQLLACRLSDGAPLIDADTQKWLATLAPAATAAAPRRPAPAAAAASAAPSEGTTPRQRFLTRLEQAEALAQTQASQVAHAALAALGQQIRALQLWQWEPDLAVRVWAAEAQALQALPLCARRDRRLARLVRNIAALDLGRAQHLDVIFTTQGAAYESEPHAPA